MDKNVLTITIDLDKKCAECGGKGAHPSGLCSACTTKAIQRRTMKSQEGRAVQKRWLAQRAGP